MADPSSYRPAAGSIPESPGVYRFRDPNGRVIYVGKATSLRQRLNSYFADVAGLHPRTRQMVTTAASVESTVVGTFRGATVVAEEPPEFLATVPESHTGRYLAKCSIRTPSPRRPPRRSGHARRQAEQEPPGAFSAR